MPFNQLYLILPSFKTSYKTPYDGLTKVADEADDNDAIIIMVSMSTTTIYIYPNVNPLRYLFIERMQHFMNLEMAFIERYLIICFLFLLRTQIVGSR